MDTFEQFADMTIAASPILTEAEIEYALANKDTDTLFRYAYRIAAFITVYCRTKVPTQTDDGDWQDAVQECMVSFPTLLERYNSTKAPFLKYMSHSFQFIIRRYLWTLANGGTGSADTSAIPVVAFTYDATEDRVDDWIDDIILSDSYLESTAFSTRDPLVELLAAESVQEALKLIKRLSTAGRKGPGVRFMVENA
jgi:hypothetical protein